MPAAMELKGKRVLVLGLGETGVAMASWLAARGANVAAADSRAAPPGAAQLPAQLPGVTLHLGGFPEPALGEVELLAISPGIALAEPFVREAVRRGLPVLGDIELFARTLPARGMARPRIVAITGTNGKSTVTALTGALCRAAGLDCEVAGNIGPAVLHALSRREAQGRLPQAWVLELSSFQLETTSTLDADAATLLNLSQDHLDRYDSMADYGAAKARIFAGTGVQVLNRDDPASLAMAIPGRPVVLFGLDAPSRSEDYGLVTVEGRRWLVRGQHRLIEQGELPLAGLHNAANVMAALALGEAIGLPMAAMFEGLRGFRGLPHRVELAGEWGGVRFYDDSKGTNVGSTVAALAGLAAGNARVVLIAGGEGKDQDFAPLVEPVLAGARGVVLIGRDAPLLEKVLGGKGIRIERAADMEEAVARAAAQAQPGDAVLLSPACASFDMFRNYAHRGDAFQAAVREWIDVRRR
jgi:UDP-N-acetylmuramoylalanine--D-glutamate ligase